MRGIIGGVCVYTPPICVLFVKAVKNNAYLFVIKAFIIIFVAIL